MTTDLYDSISSNRVAPSGKLYNDEIQLPEDVLIEIDLSGPKKSLLELISQVRTSIESHPDDLQLTIYFVSGLELTINDWGRFVDYLRSLPNPKQIVYRGVIHSETLKILTDFNNVAIDKDAKFLYIAEKLSTVLNDLVQTPDIFGKFVERWAHRYRSIDRAHIHLSELHELGFQFQIIGQ